MYKRWRSNINEVDLCFCFFWNFVPSHMRLLTCFSMMESQILMPVYPGQLRYIRKNLFHAVFVLDPASPCGTEVSFLFSLVTFSFSCIILMISDAFVILLNIADN